MHDGADVPEGPVNLDSVRVVFNEERLISDAGLLVTTTLAERLGIEELIVRRTRLQHDRELTVAQTCVLSRGPVE